MSFLTKVFSKHPPATLFLDKTSKPVVLDDQKIDIILSPCFYWVKKESLPAKSAYSAKKLLPSIFESVLPEGNYSYHAIKNGDEFEIFAYDDSLIVSALEEKGIKTSQIEGVYFAQTSIPPQEAAISISDEAAMVCQNGIWSLVPSKYVKDPVEISQIIQKIPRSKEKISLDLFKDFVLPQEQLNKVIVSFLALIVVFGFDYWLLKEEFKKQMLTQYKIIDDYGLPKTSIELQSLQGELLEVQSAQENLRTGVKNLLLLPLEAGEKFTSIEAKSGSKISFSITLKEPKRAEKIKEELAKNSRVLSLKVIDSSLKGEVGL